MKIWFFILISFIGLFPSTGFTQEDEGMLISHIDGNRYIRKDFDKSGKLKSYQAIEVGSLNKIDDKIEAKLTVITYDVNGNMKGASQTVISCDPEAKEVMMGIFPFAGGAVNKSLKVELPEGRDLYPDGWRKETDLGDFNFKLSFEGGAAGFFGTESRVAFTDRKVTEPGEGIFRVSGKMTFKAYVLGIKISTIEYNYFEDIKNGPGIIRQKFTESNGNYFTIEIKK